MSEEFLKKLNLDIDTRRLLALRIDDLLFRDADKWVKRIESLDYVPNDIARVTSTAKNRHLTDEIGDSLREYKNERMRYVGILNDYKRRLRELDEWERNKPVSPSTPLSESPPSDEIISSFRDFVKMTERIPQENVVLAAEYLEEGRIRKFLAARTFLEWIYKALGLGALIEGQGLEGKMSDCKKGRTKCETEYQDLFEYYTLLEAEYYHLEWQYNTLYAQSYVRSLQDGGTSMMKEVSSEMMNVGRCPTCNAFLIAEDLANHRCKMRLQGTATVMIYDYFKTHADREGHKIVFAKGLDGYLYRLVICKHKPPHTAKRKFTDPDTKQGLDITFKNVMEATLRGFLSPLERP